MADASSMVAVLLPDEHAARAVIERLTVDMVVVPAHWLAEVTNALLSAERTGRIPRAEMIELAERVSRIDVEFEGVSAVSMVGPVLELADRHGLTTYDAAYVELALRRGLELATVDGPLRRAARAAGVELIE